MEPGGGQTQGGGLQWHEHACLKTSGKVVRSELISEKETGIMISRITSNDPSGTDVTTNQLPQNLSRTVSRTFTDFQVW